MADSFGLSESLITTAVFELTIININQYQYQSFIVIADRPTNSPIMILLLPLFGLQQQWGCSTLYHLSTHVPMKPLGECYCFCVFMWFLSEQKLGSDLLHIFTGIQCERSQTRAKQHGLREVRGQFDNKAFISGKQCWAGLLVFLPGLDPSTSGLSQQIAWLSSRG